MIKELEEAPYSIMFDSSSDIYGGKYLAVYVRFVNFQEDAIKTKLFKVIELGSDTTGEKFLSLLEKMFLETMLL